MENKIILTIFFISFKFLHANENQLSNFNFINKLEMGRKSLSEKSYEIRNYLNNAQTSSKFSKIHSNNIKESVQLYLDFYDKMIQEVKQIDGNNNQPMQQCSAIYATIRKKYKKILRTRYIKSLDLIHQISWKDRILKNRLENSLPSIEFNECKDQVVETIKQDVCITQSPSILNSGKTTFDVMTQIIGTDEKEETLLNDIKNLQNFLSENDFYKCDGIFRIEGNKTVIDQIMDNKKDLSKEIEQIQSKINEEKKLNTNTNCDYGRLFGHILKKKIEKYSKHPQVVGLIQISNDLGNKDQKNKNELSKKSEFENKYKDSSNEVKDFINLLNTIKSKTLENQLNNEKNANALNESGFNRLFAPIFQNTYIEQSGKNFNLKELASLTSNPAFLDKIHNVEDKTQNPTKYHAIAEANVSEKNYNNQLHYFLEKYLKNPIVIKGCKKPKDFLEKYTKNIEEVKNFSDKMILAFNSNNNNLFEDKDLVSNEEFASIKDVMGKNFIYSEQFNDIFSSSNDKTCQKSLEKVQKELLAKAPEPLDPSSKLYTALRAASFQRFPKYVLLSKEITKGKSEKMIENNKLKVLGDEVTKYANSMLEQYQKTHPNK